MAKWEYRVISANTSVHLSEQLNDVAKEGWEPVLYQLATAPPGGGQQSIKELHYVIIRRSPASQ